MFKNLISILRKGDLLDQAVKDADKMMQLAEKLYDEAIHSLFEQRTAKFDIYRMDREINNLERNIRRLVLENMAYNPSPDIVASLVLTSIIIDIERIGDYSKNIHELAGLCMNAKNVKIDEKLGKDAEFILKQFAVVRNAMEADDQKEAQDLMDVLDPIRKGFDTYISDMVCEKKGHVGNAVVNALFSRYLKRVGAHLENIASSIANPFDRIGFYRDKHEIE